jgi:O-antigen ligase
VPRLQYSRMLVYSLVMIPLIPKIKVFGAGESPILLDDFVLLMCVCLGLAALVLRAAVVGRISFPVNPVVVAFSIFLLYKITFFFILAFFLPWINSLQLARGIVFGEGILVVTKTSFIFAAFLVVLVVLRGYDDARNALQAMILCIVLVVAVGLAQFAILDHTVLTSTFRNVYALGIKIPGRWMFDDPWFGHAAVGHEHFGAFMIISFALFSGMLLCGYPSTPRRRFALIVLWGLCIFSLVFSSSRGAWIGWCCSLGALGLWQMSRGKLLQACLYGVVAVLALAVADQIWNLQLEVYITKRVEGLVAAFSGEIKDVSAIKRIELFGKLWGRFIERPLIGWGAGSAGRIAEGQHIRELVEGGIVGWGLFVGMLTICGWQARKRYKASDDPLVRGSNVGLISAIVGLLGQSAFTELFILTKVGVPFWVLVAILQRLDREAAG